MLDFIFYFIINYFIIKQFPSISIGKINDFNKIYNYFQITIKYQNKKLNRKDMNGEDNYNTPGKEKQLPQTDLKENPYDKSSQFANNDESKYSQNNQKNENHYQEENKDQQQLQERLKELQERAVQIQTRLKQIKKQKQEHDQLSEERYAYEQERAELKKQLIELNLQHSRNITLLKKLHIRQRQQKQNQIKKKLEEIESQQKLKRSRRQQQQKEYYEKLKQQRLKREKQEQEEIIRQKERIKKRIDQKINQQKERLAKKNQENLKNQKKKYQYSSSSPPEESKINIRATTDQEQNNQRKDPSSQIRESQAKDAQIIRNTQQKIKQEELQNQIQEPEISSQVFYNQKRKQSRDEELIRIKYQARLAEIHSQLLQQSLRRSRRVSLQSELAELRYNRLPLHYWRDYYCIPRYEYSYLYSSSPYRLLSRQYLFQSEIQRIFYRNCLNYRRYDYTGIIWP